MESGLAGPTRRNGAGFLFRSLRSRNYRLFYFGQGISLIGTWTQQVAISWLVYRLTGSTVLLGVVAFSNQIPSLFFGPFAGVIADRWDRKRLLLWTQALSMLQALTLAALVLSGIVQSWHIVALSLFIGTVNAFDIPIRQSFVVEMVEGKEDLGNAIALNSAMFNGARLIGPSVAGVLILGVGEGVCFLLNGISYLAVLAALNAIRVSPRELPVKREPAWREFCEGVRYVYNFKPIMAILSLLSLFSLAGTPFFVLMPAYAKDILLGDAQTFGFLMSASGFGAVAATIYLASRKSVHGLVKLIPGATGAFGAGVAAFALSRNLTFSLFCVFLAGFGMLTQIASSNTIIQTVVDEDKRGRTMGLFAMSFMGVMPFGSLLAGSAAASIGVRNTLLLGAAFCIAGALFFAARLPLLTRSLHPLFSRTE